MSQTRPRAAGGMPVAHGDLPLLAMLVVAFDVSNTQTGASAAQILWLNRSVEQSQEILTTKTHPARDGHVSFKGVQQSNPRKASLHVLVFDMSISRCKNHSKVLTHALQLRNEIPCPSIRGSGSLHGGK